MRKNEITQNNLLDEKGFVFIDENNRPYWCRMYYDNPWWMYWHENQKSWVTYRKVTQGEVFACSQMKISEDLAEIYHKQHEKFIGGN